jgi:hypothetical protein
LSTSDAQNTFVHHFFFTITIFIMANISLSNISKMEGISTDPSGNYRQYDALSALLASKTLTTLSEKLIGAVAELDALIADSDGKVILTVRGVEGESQFTPDTAFRTALASVQTAVAAAATSVAAIQVPVP